MTVHAHPDDESSKGAATLARYAQEGVEVLVVTCTGGERGDILNPAADTEEARTDLAAVRRREMAEAARILGVRQVFLGFTDSGMPPEGQPLPEGCFAALPVPETAKALAEVVREFRPHVVVTYDETGGYPHPDHIRTHEVTVAALEEAAPDWAPSKLYYQATLSRAWFEALHHGLVARGVESGLAEVLADLPAAPHPITTQVPCAEHFDTRDRALLAHRTQVNPDHPFFTHPREVEREVWPTEDYHLAWSAVATELPEDDLFAGLRPGPR